MLRRGEQALGRRQLYDLADRLRVKPPAPLPVELFAGLPLPAALW